MSSNVQCPVCGGGYSTQGFQTHLKSHNKDEIVAGVAELLISGTTQVSGSGGYKWNKDQTERITAQATRAVEKIKAKSNRSRDRIDNKVANTLRENS